MPPFIKLSFFFILGISFSRVLGIPISLSGDIIILSILTFVLTIRTIHKKYKCTSLIFLTTIMMGIIQSQIQISNHFSKNSILEEITNQEAFSIIKINSVSKTMFGYKFDAVLKAFESEAHDLKEIGSKIILYSSDSLQIQENKYYAAVIKIRLLENPKNPCMPNFKNILANKNIFFQGNFVKTKTPIELKNKKLSIKEWFIKIRQKAIIKISRHLQSDKSKAIVAALVFGDKTQLSKKTKEAFTDSGSIHILAVSGLHVGLVYSIVLMLTFFIQDKNKYAIIILLINASCILSYMFITGLSTSVTRASIMIILFLIGRSFGKFTSLFNFIGLAALIILFENPNELFAVSFQFSFLALISILFFYKRLESFYCPTNKICRYIYQLILVSISAQILVFPLVIFYFNQFPMYFWLSGIIAVPLSFLTIVLTFSLLLFSLLNLEFINFTIASLMDFCINIMHISMAKISQLPLSTLEQISISPFNLFSVYALLIIIIITLSFRIKEVIFLLPLIIIINSAFTVILKNKSWKKSELVVYHFNKKSYIHINENGQVYELFSNGMTDKVIENITFKYNHCHYICNQDSDEKPFEQKSGLFKWKETIFSINPIRPIYNCSRPIAFLILTKNDIEDISHFISNNEVNKIILDGSWHYSKEKKEILKLAERHAIPVHDTYSKGAFIFSN
ncbi:MAG: ComEC/Rec2 family competence protein [Saprospiraceae bacterium]|nr:competence protein ComEC family protein [Bacteroidia bacterium]NNL93106.1 ComEC/Rec2 family competence protein [Saprospiraceae bacterium]